MAVFITGVGQRAKPTVVVRFPTERFPHDTPGRPGLAHPTRLFPGGICD